MIHRPSDLRGIIKIGFSHTAKVSESRVLSVEDDPDCARLIEESLRSAGHIVRVLARPDELLSELSVFRPEILLLDCDLPNVTGFDLAKVVRSDSKYETIPIVFCTSRSERFERRAASRAGADDFISKPFTPEELVEAIETHLRRHRALRKKLDTDPLTDLLNRAAAIEALDDLMTTAHHNRSGVLVGIVDIDNFKQVNDVLGHPTGDRVLQAVASHLRTSLRADDVAGRLGGEEFVIGMSGATVEPLRRKLDRIRSSMVVPLRMPDGSTRSVTFSAGLAWFPEHGVHASTLLKFADLALYEAKKSGRNRIMLHGDPAGI